MADSENIEKARSAFDAANKNLSNPAGGSYETATVVALIGIGHALVEVAEQLKSIKIRM